MFGFKSFIREAVQSPVHFLTAFLGLGLGAALSLGVMSGALPQALSQFSAPEVEATPVATQPESCGMAHVMDGSTVRLAIISGCENSGTDI